MTEEYAIVFDGGSRGNPGPAYGSYRVSPWPPDETRLIRLEFGPATNNQAEYLTLLAALDALEAFLAGRGASTHQVVLEVKGDSQLVFNQLDGTWRVKSGELRPLYERAARLLAAFLKVNLNPVPRSDIVEILGH